MSGSAFTQNVTVRYRDGRAAQLELTQYSLARFALWARKHSITVGDADPLASVVMLRYQAWAEIKRDGGMAQTFDAWDGDVLEVVPEDVQPVNPTGAATSDA